MSIVDRIREEGEKYNLTIASIERKLDISNGTIRKWENGKPSSESLYKVSKLLNCTMEYLLTGINEPSQLSPEEMEWLNLYKQLSCTESKIRNECIGFVKGYIARENITPI